MMNGYMTGRGGYCLSKTADVKCPALMNTLKVGVICCLMDDELTFLWGNSCFYGSIHYSEEEYRNLFQGLRQYFMEYPEDFSSVIQALQSQKNSSAGIELTVRLPIRNGRFLWARLYGTVRDDQEVGGLVFQAEFANISGLIAEKEEQERLHKQKLQYFQWMMDLYVGNVYVSDMDTYELLYLNQTACDTLGRQVGDLLGRKCYEVIQGRTSPCPFCTNEKLRDDTFYEWEFSNPVLERTFLIKDRMINWNGRKARIELSHDMYSEEYKLAKKDREREALVRSIPGGLARLDARDFSTVLWYGADFLNMIDYTEDQFDKELHHQFTGYILEEDWMRILPVLEKMKSTGENIITEARFVTRSNKVRVVTLTLTYARAEDSWDGIPSFYSIGIDVTKERVEQTRQRQALEDAYNSARVANDAKTNFLSSMSHDIRTPMNAIMGMAAIAQANLKSPEKVQDCLGKINISSRHLLSLINEVLDMSKIESGKIDLIAEEVSLPDLMENVMDMFRPLVEENHQELQINVDHVRHERVVTDGGRLRQVFTNILSNAVKYTPECGTISLWIRELPSITKDRGQYEFIVTDNGIGMSEKFIPHIFEPFSRADDSRTGKIQGTGLGMAITENIIRMMNGTIEVKSILGKGSQFIVAVSLELCEKEGENNLALTGLPVLVVDDDQVVCESAVELLNELGMQGSWVLSGQEAVRCIVEAHNKEDDFFSVILDWRMPEMDGLATTREIRKKLGTEVPIIIISAYDYSDIEEDFRDAGANAFITKPLFKSKIVHVLHQFSQVEYVETTAVPSSEACFAMAGKRILLVEDNELNREIAAELLKMQGFCIDEAENGQLAVDKFQASSPGEYDGILMDIQMPVMDGYAATEAIRALKRKDAQTIPILALTANAFASDLGKAHSAGMNDHIAKPIDMERLMEALQTWIK